MMPDSTASYGSPTPAVDEEAPLPELVLVREYTERRAEERIEVPLLSELLAPLEELVA